MSVRKAAKIIIAIDGYSACGKSTIAKEIAKKFGFMYIDTGAMYRATTLYFLDNQVDIDNKLDVSTALDRIHITFDNSTGENFTILNGTNVEEDIRSLKVSNMVSEVAALPDVRKRMVALQRLMSKGDQSVVLDGRDIGTVVFPDADLKFFITADPLVRAQRRLLELQDKGMTLDLQEILNNLSHRDRIDSTREDSPLMKAEDAIEIDTSDYSPVEQRRIIFDYIKSKFNTDV